MKVKRSAMVSICLYSKILKERQRKSCLSRLHALKKGGVEVGKILNQGLHKRSKISALHRGQNKSMWGLIGTQKLLVCALNI